MMEKWKLEDDVNDYVKKQLEDLGFKKLKDYNVESCMSDYMKEALKGSAKTRNKTNFGKPDFHIEKKYHIPVIFENKLGLKKLITQTREGIKSDDKSIKDFAVNGILHYATQMIASGKYNEVIAVGVAGNSEEEVEIRVYYVYGSSMKSVKYMNKYTTLAFLANKNSFENFYKDAVLTEEEKHDLLITSKKMLNEYAAKLNKLMHNHNITAPQRVLYVSGMLLSMQDIIDGKGEKIQDGLTPDDLRGIQTETKRDGKIIVSQIEEFLTARNIDSKKKKLMLASFSEISKDPQRDELTEVYKEVSKLLDRDSSCNKQVFTYIYEYVFKQIDSIAGHIDIIGEMYSEFLKYALGDGKEIGIVLTPPYVTKMMAEILEVNMDSKVMDLATGSAGFLISSMELMIQDANDRYTEDTDEAKRKIEEIKQKRLLGVELNAEMYTLAATNMILRGDGSSNIRKGNTFRTPDELYTNFKADRILLNPPFSFEENGMPFIAFGLEKMERGGLGAIIIQDSAGSGKAMSSNKKILKNHTLLASIKMPIDLFIPMAGVQTSIYVFRVGTPHDFEKTVKFIDFRNDGYKRTKRGLIEIDEPTKRYQDVIKIYKAGKQAKVDKAHWNLDEVYVEDFITDSGADWNFDQHKPIDTKPKLEDFKKVVSDYLAWEVSNILKKEDTALRKMVSPRLEKLEKEFLQNGGHWKALTLEELFYNQNGNVDIQNKHINGIGEFVISSGNTNRGIIGKSDILANTIHRKSLTVDMFGNVYARDFPYKLVTHARVFSLIPKVEMNIKVLNYIAASLFYLTKLYGYSNMATFEKIKNEKITLPFLNGEIYFFYMEKYIEELEVERIEELEAYLAVTRSKDYALTEDDTKVLHEFNRISKKRLDRQTQIGRHKHQYN